MDAKLFLDTNILVYLSNPDSPFYSPTMSFMEKAKEQYELWISDQVLREYAVVVSRPTEDGNVMGSDEIVNDLIRLEKFFNVVEPTTEVRKVLKQLIVRYDLKGKIIHDANIVASMIVERIGKVCTWNVGDFKRFDEITVIKPEL